LLTGASVTATSLTFEGAASAQALAWHEGDFVAGDRGDPTNNPDGFLRQVTATPTMTAGIVTR
jgi:hypothetical protein